MDAARHDSRCVCFAERREIFTKQNCKLIMQKKLWNRMCLGDEIAQVAIGKVMVS